MNSKTPPLLPRFLRAIYWFDEALRASQELQGQTPVTRAQAMLLINIALGERRPTRLARTMGVTKQAVSLMLADLTAAGYIFIKPDPEDARASVIEFSPLGHIELTNIFAALEHVEDHLATVIGQDRMSVLRAALGMDWGAPPALGSTESRATEDKIQKN
ncbi:helix-turn-helix domain-containing protein (plasmid) [Agrobacterium vitis]|uniref:MarR family winged helix-turn-helix transcriptional regulator n=1 Tax=Agrobacterium vitis TaxID=373 RepID=UPI0012E96637|nr:helix-turn-helix domain-containing protein [Agrobacterium vitis]MVA27747.1 MarR family transcriptional regulator [Agrobacterium vitis]